MNSGIYKITNLKNGKLYVGSASSLSSRKRQHFSDLSLKKHSNIHLQRAYDKYGKDLFEFETIEFCSVDDLLEREQFWIDSYSVTQLYNISLNATSRKGVKVSDETRAKISQASKGRVPWNKGKTGIYSEETLAKISKGAKKSHTEEAKEKIRTSLVGNKRSLGFKHSEETKEKHRVRMLINNPRKRS